MIRTKCNWDPASKNNGRTRAKQKILPARFPRHAARQNRHAAADASKLEFAHPATYPLQIASRHSKI